VYNVHLTSFERVNVPWLVLALAVLCRGPLVPHYREHILGIDQILAVLCRGPLVPHYREHILGIDQILAVLCRGPLGP